MADKGWTDLTVQHLTGNSDSAQLPSVFSSSSIALLEASEGAHGRRDDPAGW